MLVVTFPTGVNGIISVAHGSCQVREDGLYFFLWSETADPKRRRDKTAHPFSRNLTDNRELFIRSGMLDGIDFKGVKLDAYFPSTDTAPLPSNELVGLVDFGNSAGEMPVVMKKWEVAGILLPLYDAFIMLLNMSKLITGDNFIIGTDLKFWRSVSIFAFNLLSDQKFLPTISEDGTTVRSKWIPLLETQEDQNLLLDLTKGMPGACMSLNHGEVDAETLVHMFISTVIDHACRKFSADVSLPVKESSGSDILKWLTSLSSGKSLITYGRSLAMQKILSWTRRILSNLEFPMRTCFDLVPPATDDDEWALRFLLQSKTDPSLLVPFSSIWDRKDADAISVIRKFTDFPEEFLLHSLGVAQSIFPPINNSLQSARPAEVVLKAADVYDFLKSYSTILGESGFGVMFPEWWGKTKKGLGLKARIKPISGSGSGKFGLQTLIDYELEILVDGEVVSTKELERLSRLKIPLMQIGKKWVEVDREHLDEILELLKKNMQNVPLIDLLTLDTENGSVPIVDIDAKGWIGELFNGTSGVTGIKDPIEFRGKLRDYQRQGVSWLAFMTDAGFGCCLADDMGLGKTIEILAFLLHRTKKQKKGGVSLILCPTSVISNWVHEFSRFAPSLKIAVHHGPLRKKGDEFINDIVNSDILLTSYSLLQRDAEFLSQVKWDGVIADEAQYIKNYSAKQSKAIRALTANYRIALTGTPIENRLDDLRSIFEFLNTGYLGSERKFKKVFSSPIEREGNEDAAKKLSRIVKPFILRRVKADKNIISDLPEKDESKIFVPVTKEQASLYDATVSAMLKDIEEAEGIKRKGIILSTITKLKRLLDHPSLVFGDSNKRWDRSEKMVRLMDMLGETIATNEKTIVFTQYVEAGVIIKESVMRKFQEEVLFLSGSTPRVIRDQMIARFQSPDGPRIFVISVKAGGFGINLTAATNVIHFDRWWNPAVEDQATDRAYRIGQSKTVHVYKFVSAGTIEEKIDQIIEEKSQLRKKIVNASDESWITDLSKSELRNVFSLRRETVMDGSDA